MKTNYSYRYLTMAALVGLWSCSSSRQTAQNVGEMDDLYGNSANAAVYASTSSDGPSVAQRPSRQQQRMERQQRSSRSDNPEYSDDQQGYSANTDEYYAELSARKLNRGLSPDPGWNDQNSYNSGFVNGYNAANTSAYSWNRWGFNNTGFYSGLGLGLGLGAFGGYGGFNSFGMGFGNPFYSPFYGNSFAYGGGYGGGYYDPFYSSYYGGYGGGFNPFYGGFNSFYSPFYGGGFYGGGYGRPVIVNNVLVTGADPYRNRSYGPRYDRSSSRYNDAFVNTPRSNNDPNAGGRRASGNT
ncbi:MAG: hypothetical protein JWP57_3572, partial [Spirosoma sp.]|nr:hypothetical protein [Spirosoma sp.]